MQALFWYTKSYLTDASSLFWAMSFCAISMVPFFHATRLTGVITSNHTNKAINWILNVKHTVHHSKHKCSLMHAFSFQLFNCDYSVGFQFMKRLKSTLLSCNLELKARLRTHLEKSVISISSISCVHDRQATDSCSYRFKMNNDFLSRKSQGTAWVALADCIEKDCRSRSFSAFPLLLLKRFCLKRL